MLELTKVTVILSEVVDRIVLGTTCIIKPCRPNNWGEEPPVHLDKCDPLKPECLPRD